MGSLNFGGGNSCCKVLCGLVTTLITHFTVVCFVTWPLSESETGGDLALIQTFLPFIC